MNIADFGSIIVALIATLGAWAAQKAASNANRSNTTVSGKIEAEKGAYERARSFDIQTIDRQHKEILDLQNDNIQLRQEIVVLRLRINKIEKMVPDWERIVHEREQESNSDE